MMMVMTRYVEDDKLIQKFLFWYTSRGHTLTNVAYEKHTEISTAWINIL
jgi:uncharacterized protein YjdB